MSYKVVCIILCVVNVASAYGLSVPDARQIQTRASSDSSFSCSLVSPAPTGHICEKKGILKSPYSEQPSGIEGILGADSFETCRNVCMTRIKKPRGSHGVAADKCNGIYYNATSGVCKLIFDGTPLSAFRALADSDTVYSEKQCYTCTKPCSRLPGEELLYNGGFEMQTDPFSKFYYGPWTEDGFFPSGIPQPASPGYKSQRAVECNTGRCLLIQFPDLCPGQNYIFRAAVMRVPSNTSQRSRLPSFNTVVLEGGHIYGTIFDDQVGEWLTLELYTSLATESSFAVDILFEIIPSGNSILFDGASLMVAPPIGSTAGNSLLTNGDFETGSLAPCVTGEESLSNQTTWSIISPGLNGSDFAVRYKAKGYASKGHLLSQPKIPTQPGKRYTIRFDWSAISFKGQLKSEFGVFVFASKTETGFTTLKPPPETYWEVISRNQKKAHRFERTFVAFSNQSVVAIWASNADFTSENERIGLQERAPKELIIDNIEVFELA